MTYRSIALTFSLVAAGLAAPASAQYGSSAPRQMPQPTPQASQAEAAPASKLNISKGAYKALSELQAAVKANTVAEIPGKIAAAKAVVQTPDDRYILGQLQLKAASAAKDNNAVAAAIEAMIASGGTPQPQLLPLYLNLAKLQYDAKQFDAAAADLDHVIALDPNDAEAIAMLAETRNLQGRKADAVTTIQRALQVRSAGGNKAPEDWYKRAVALAYEAKSPSAIDFSRQWVAAYPSPANWREALRVYRSIAKPESQTLLDTLRLARVTGALSGDEEFQTYAYTASGLHGAGEAKALLAEAAAAKQIDPSKPWYKETTATLRTSLVPNDAYLANMAKTAQASSDGKLAMAAGDAFYGHGDYARAADLYRAALTKGAADASLVNLHLGMALARSGDKPGATAALNAVTGARADIAKYWLTYVTVSP